MRFGTVNSFGKKRSDVGDVVLLDAGSFSDNSGSTREIGCGRELHFYFRVLLE